MQTSYEFDFDNSTILELPGGDHKLLLTAYKSRRIMCTEFLISLSSNDFSPYSDTCVGKLRSVMKLLLLSYVSF